MPLVTFFHEHAFSLTWDTGTVVKLIGKDFLMPGENGESVHSIYVVQSPKTQSNNLGSSSPSTSLCSSSRSSASLFARVLSTFSAALFRSNYHSSGHTTIATGVFLEVLPKQTEKEKEKAFRHVYLSCSLSIR